MFIIFVTVLWLSCTVNSLKHEERAQEVIAHVKRVNSTWTAKTNAIFAGKEEKATTKFLGINITELKNLTPRVVQRPPVRNHTFQNHNDYQTNLNHAQNQNRSQNQPNSGDIWNKSIPGQVGINRRTKRKTTSVPVATTIPTEFDWRKFDCESFRDIRYQNCGDCWAIASASVMSDRYCLYTGRNKIFSAREILTCAYPSGQGCNGGVPNVAMAYYHSRGVASGGDSRVLGEILGCLPYLTTNQTICSKKCDSGQKLDTTKAGEYNDITTQNVTQIMNEIYKYGPVVAVFEVFDDFEYMGTGIYKHVWGNSQGYHAVRLLGYGTDNGTDYWLAANSWGTDWGDKGFFKILRGQNHCDIESWIATVYPPEAYS